MSERGLWLLGRPAPGGSLPIDSVRYVVEHQGPERLVGFFGGNRRTLWPHQSLSFGSTDHDDILVTDLSASQTLEWSDDAQFPLTAKQAADSTQSVLRVGESFELAGQVFKLRAEVIEPSRCDGELAESLQLLADHFDAARDGHALEVLEQIVRNNPDQMWQDLLEASSPISEFSVHFRAKRGGRAVSRKVKKALLRPEAYCFTKAVLRRFGAFDPYELLSTHHAVRRLVENLDRDNDPELWSLLFRMRHCGWTWNFIGTGLPMQSDVQFPAFKQAIKSSCGMELRTCFFALLTINNAESRRLLRTTSPEARPYLQELQREMFGGALTLVEPAGATSLAKTTDDSACASVKP